MTQTSPARTRSVQRVVHADAATIFDLLADPQAHHRFDGSGTVQGTPHGPGRLHQGARFTMQMKRGPVGYRSSSRVVEFEEGRRIAWQVVTERGDKVVFGGQIWRYELEPVADGTLVRETFDYAQGTGPTRWLIETSRMADKHLPAMTATLDRLARAAEQR